MKQLHHVVVAGLGVLGAQIAYHIAYSGFAVTGYDVNQESLDAGRVRLEQLRDRYGTRSLDRDTVKAQAGTGVPAPAPSCSATAGADSTGSSASPREPPKR